MREMNILKIIIEILKELIKILFKSSHAPWMFVFLQNPLENSQLLLLRSRTLGRMGLLSELVIFVSLWPKQETGGRKDVVWLLVSVHTFFQD